MLGEAEAVGAAQRLVGVVLAGAAVLLFVRLQRAQDALKGREDRDRFASNLRDALNLVSVAALAVAFRVAGAPWPAAILLAGSIGIVLELLRHAKGTPVARFRRSLAVGLVLAVPAAAMVPPVVDGANRIVAFLFG